MSITGGIMAGVGLAGSIGGAAIASNAAGNAASTQANAADQAAQLQYQASQNALDFQKQQWEQSQQNIAPWLQSGRESLGNLDYLMGIGSQGDYANGPSGGLWGAQPPTANQGLPGNPLQLSGAPAINYPQPGATGPIAGGQRGMGGVYAPQPMSGAASGVMGALTNGGQTTLPGQPVSPSGLSPISGKLGAAPLSGAMPAGAAGAVAGPAGSTPAYSGAFGSLMQPYGQTFSMPTAADMEANDAGYQERLKLGTDAIQRSAAARGGVVTGGTAAALNQFGQDYASNEYGNYFNQKFNTYAQNYNQWAQQQANEYNRLASMAGMGQTAAGQLGTLGQNASNAVGNNLMGTAAQMGSDYQNAAAASASGYVGGANAWNGALGGMGSNISNLLMLQQMYGGGGGANPYQTLYNAQQYPDSMPSTQSGSAGSIPYQPVSLYGQ